MNGQKRLNHATYIKSRLQNGYKVVPTGAIYTLVRTHIY